MTKSLNQHIPQCETSPVHPLIVRLASHTTAQTCTRARHVWPLQNMFCVSVGRHPRCSALQTAGHAGRTARSRLSATGLRSPARRRVSTSTWLSNTSAAPPAMPPRLLTSVCSRAPPPNHRRGLEGHRLEGHRSEGHRSAGAQLRDSWLVPRRLRCRGLLVDRGHLQQDRLRRHLCDPLEPHHPRRPRLNSHPPPTHHPPPTTSTPSHPPLTTHHPRTALTPSTLTRHMAAKHAFPAGPVLTPTAERPQTTPATRTWHAARSPTRASAVSPATQDNPSAVCCKAKRHKQAPFTFLSTATAVSTIRCCSLERTRCQRMLASPPTPAFSSALLRPRNETPPPLFRRRPRLVLGLQAGQRLPDVLDVHRKVWSKPRILGHRHCWKKPLANWHARYPRTSLITHSGGKCVEIDKVRCQRTTLGGAHNTNHNTCLRHRIQIQSNTGMNPIKYRHFDSSIAEATPRGLLAVPERHSHRAW